MPKGSKRKEKPLHSTISVVGPEYFQLLQGQLFVGNNTKQVALILCGESHYDGIDVTRSGGRFAPREGWVQIGNNNNNNNDLPILIMEEPCACRILQQTKKLLPVGKAQEWAKAKVEEDDLQGELVLAWIETDDSGRKGSSRGKGYLLELVTEEELQEDEEEDMDHWLHSGTTTTCTTEQYPQEIQNWVLSSGAEQGPRPSKMFEWGDLDPETHAINKRRLTQEVVSVEELDALVNKRKQDRKRQNIWTFDDWFAHIRKDTSCNVHLVVEASVPPWEVELHRPPNTPEGKELAMLPLAADCYRCVSEDSDCSSEDDHDASSDGIGTYLDYVYRRFIGEMVQEQQQQGAGTDADNIQTTWCHCIDVRDLGSQEACHADVTKNRWKSLLTPQERTSILPDNNDTSEDSSCDFPRNDNKLPFRAERELNMEQQSFEEKLKAGKLEPSSDEEPEQHDHSNLEISYPSFEAFFGQNTDVLYYAPHVRLSYSPFLAKVVRSLSNWEQFFTQLFLTGTISEALTFLDLQGHMDHVYIRSPILKDWDPASNSYIWKERPESDEYIMPFLPCAFHLQAKGSDRRSRTWSSALYSNLHSSESFEHQQFAKSVLQWTMRNIQHLSKDPKRNDDPEFGGEWFLAYLRAAHREIYEDMDHGDAGELLKRKNVPSFSGPNKHRIGDIQVPSCESSFEEIVKRFEATPSTPLLTGPPHPIDSRTEVLAKILIDIWVHQLIDHCSVLKIGNIVAQNSPDNKIVFVIYTGVAHTRAVADYFCTHAKFQKKGFYGKVNWEDDENRKIQLPSKLWNVSELFQAG
ncbi:expressed unknown protein [Seminavis robusta]|uniref:Uncharacterized protein n=1 Tax=Seminavis robusta TaxID=568900 RepID=A0A9N8E9N5_9STRA|nr:expressed unknown protein [Seminavis robusta]|eukprot:Sro700_g189620.1 n/a (805) ;mRNA; f:20804-23218